MRPDLVGDLTEVPSQTRLQRAPDFTGGRLNSFRQIFLRHGLPGALLGVMLLALPGMWILLESSTSPDHTFLYLSWGIAIAFALSIYAAVIDKGWRPMQLGWVLYLGLLSLWEEWLFRIAMPSVLSTLGISLFAAVIISNVAFGAMHYFTLRWKWPWCFGAFLGGLALSRQLEVHQDLLLITAYHWIGTFLNTPRSPGSRYKESEPKEDSI